MNYKKNQNLINTQLKEDQLKETWRNWKTKNTYIISSHNFQDGNEWLRERHLNQVVPQEKWHA